MKKRRRAVILFRCLHCCTIAVGPVQSLYIYVTAAHEKIYCRLLPEKKDLVGARLYHPLRPPNRPFELCRGTVLKTVLHDNTTSRTRTDFCWNRELRFEGARVTPWPRLADFRNPQYIENGEIRNRAECFSPFNEKRSVYFVRFVALET